MSRHDAVILGAGVNGLAAAVHLASKGWDVAVVEASATAGGAVKTMELLEPGFWHDLGAMNLSMFAGSPFHAQYSADLAAHGLEFAPAANCFASVFRDGTCLGVGQDKEATRKAIEGLSPGDAGAWDEMNASFGEMAPHIFALLGSPMPSFKALKAAWNARRAGGWPLVYEIGRLLLSSPREFLDRHFESDRLKAMMAAWGLHLDFPPDAAGGALFPYLETMANNAFGMVIGRGGADTIVKAMAGLIESRGGRIVLGTAVKRVVVENGKATGVVLADGTTLSATRAVISNVHPKLLFGGMVPEAGLPERFTKGLASYRAGPGTMMVHLTMDGLPEWTASPDLKSYAYVHVAPDMAMMSRLYDEAVSGLLPGEPALVVGQPTAVDPTRAPEGKHVLWVQVRLLPAAIRGDAAGKIGGRDWASARDAYAERVIDIIETHAPGVRDLIRRKAVHSPADLEGENPNLIGGDSLSGSHHLDQNFLFRPVAGYSRYRTPVGNLFMCGAATWPGAGTGAGSGFMLARTLAG